MCRIWLAGLLGTCILGGCAGAHHPTNDELADLYLSTLDDKHFVWCTTDLEQCRKDINEWKQTERGRALLSEYEKEQAGKTYHTYEFTEVFEKGDIIVTPTKYGPALYPKNGRRTHNYTNSAP